MGERLLSRRDRLIVARHEVPGKAPLKAPSRRVRYDRAPLIPNAFWGSFRFCLAIPHSVRTPAESYRTLRDGSFGWRGPRHFVPGYDHAVPLTVGLRSF